MGALQASAEAQNENQSPVLLKRNLPRSIGCARTTTAIAVYLPNEGDLRTTLKVHEDMRDESRACGPRGLIIPTRRRERHPPELSESLCSDRFRQPSAPDIDM
jgi:hypothetical protein